MKACIDSMVTKVELIKDFKKYGKRYVHEMVKQKRCFE
jgi:hypothetical protein